MKWLFWVFNKTYGFREKFRKTFIFSNSEHRKKFSEKPNESWEIELESIQLGYKKKIL